MIQEHNANPDKEHFATVNRFTDMSSGEFAAFSKGRKRGAIHLGSSRQMYKPSGKPLPDSIDWRDHGVVTPPKDQGGCGSCWAFSAAQSLESHLAIATGNLVALSPQQIVSCAPNPDHCGGSGGCDGSTQPLAFNYTETAGITTEASYPYAGRTGTCDTSKITPVGHNSGYVELPENNYTALMDAVANQGPIAISIAAGGFHFQFYGGGILKNCNDFVMDHAVQLVGYGSESGQDYWLVRNSWGASWGESGYIRMARYGEGNEPCGEDKNPQDGDACEGDTAPRNYCGECGILSSSSYPTGMSASTVV
jgi:cathepsin L